MQETQVQCLRQEDLLEKEMATHSSILAWRIPWAEEPTVGYSLWGLKELDTTERLHFTSLQTTTMRVFAICLCRDWTLCCFSCWLSTPYEGVQGGVMHSVLQGIWWNRSLDSWISLGTDIMIPSPASDCIQKSTKSIHGDIRSSWLWENLL